jgi:hypothetical protein
VLFQPWNGTFIMEPMLAWKKCDNLANITLFTAQLHCIQANGAFDLAVRSEEVLVHGLALQLRNRLFRHTRRVGVRLGFHELADNPIKGFLGVDSIAHHGISWVEMAQDFLQISEKPKATIPSLRRGGHIPDDV